MKKTRRFVALLLAAVLALALFTACGAAEQPQSAIGKVYEDWFVEQINSKRPGKPVQKVDVKHSEMRTALAKISEDGKFKARDGGLPVVLHSWFQHVCGSDRRNPRRTS